MRVLLVTKIRSGGGTERHVGTLAGLLHDRRIGVDTAYTKDGFWRLYRTIRDWHPDIVHFFLPQPYLIGSLVCELAGQHNRIMSRRSLRSCYQTRLIRWIEKLLHRRTRVLIGNSPAVCSELAEEAPSRPITLIRNGVFGPLWQQHIVSHRFSMLCVANAFPYKGHLDLIEAVNRIRAVLPEGWMLRLAGHGTERFDDKTNIIGLGYCDNVPTLLAMSDLLILPSHEEGSSNALLEAMAAGVPVIATNVGGNKDAITQFQTGMLVPPRNPKILSDAILFMAQHPEQRQMFARVAQADIAKRFSWQRCVDEYEAVYRSILEGPATVHRAVHQVCQ